MKVGDLVMFTNEGAYAKWFFGRIGKAETITYGRDGKLYCRVRWIQPVSYHKMTTLCSDFPVDYFEIAND